MRSWLLSDCAAIEVAIVTVSELEQTEGRTEVTAADPGPDSPDGLSRSEAVAQRACGTRAGCGCALASPGDSGSYDGDSDGPAAPGPAAPAWGRQPQRPSPLHIPKDPRAPGDSEATWHPADALSDAAE